MTTPTTPQRDVLDKLRDLWRARPGVVMLVAAVFILAVVVVIAVIGANVAPSGSSGGSSGTTTQWFNDTGDSLVVEFTSPGPAQDQTNLIVPDGQTISPQSAAPDTGANSALCTVTFPDGITWKVFNTNTNANPTDNPAAIECSTIENQPGAN